MNSNPKMMKKHIPMFFVSGVCLRNVTAAGFLSIVHTRRSVVSTRGDRIRFIANSGRIRHRPTNDATVGHGNVFTAAGGLCYLGAVHLLVQWRMTKCGSSA